MELKQKNKIISLLNQLYIYFYWSKINKRIGLCRVHLSCPCEGLWKTSSLVWFEYTWTCPCEGLLMTIDKYLVWLSLGAFELVRVSWGLLKTSIVWFGLGWVGCTWTCLCWGLWWPPPPPRWQTCRSSCQSSTEPPTVVLGHLRTHESERRRGMRTWEYAVGWVSFLAKHALCNIRKGWTILTCLNKYDISYWHCFRLEKDEREIHIFSIFILPHQSTHPNTKLKMHWYRLQYSHLKLRST